MIELDNIDSSTEDRLFKHMIHRVVDPRGGKRNKQCQIFSQS